METVSGYAEMNSRHFAMFALSATNVPEKFCGD
jgi:hypothetical protein